MSDDALDAPAGTAPPTITVAQAGAAGTNIVTGDTTTLARVPPEVFARFPGCGGAVASGAEAVVLTGDDPEFGAVAVKVYRPGTRTNSSLLATLDAADLDHVVRLHWAGEIGGSWVEVLERIDGGTLADLLAGGALDEATRRTIVSELTEAIAHFHDLNLIHRDVKPANVLVRTRDPLDLVLADFGLAVVDTGGLDFGAQDRTIPYSSPDTQAGLRIPQGDWWSVGIIVLEMVLGHHPFSGFTDAEIAIELAARDVKLDGVADERWRLLIAGLLSRDIEHRWSEAQVREWLAGGSPQVVRQALSPNPYEFEGERFGTQRELVAAMSQNWDAAVRLVRGATALAHLGAWLAAHDPSNARTAILVDEVRVVDEPELRLFRLLRGLQPDLAAVFRSFALDGDGLALLAKSAVNGGPDSAEASAIDALFDQRILRFLSDHGAEVDAAWHDAMTRVVALTDAHLDRELEREERTLLRARLLACLEDAADRQTALDRATTLTRGDAADVDWFARLARTGTTSLPEAVAADVLSRRAEEEVAATRAAATAQREQALRDARAETSRRYPRTRRYLGVVLWVLGVLAAAGVAARFVRVDAPFNFGQLGGTPDLLDPAGRVTAFTYLDLNFVAMFTEDLLPLRSVIMRIANPVLPALVFAVGLTLWIRGRRVGRRGSEVTRSEWERRGMQATIVAACLYLPLLIPFVVAFAYRDYYADSTVARGSPPRSRYRRYRRTLNVAGAGYALHALSLIAVRSPDLRNLVLQTPSWFTRVRDDAPEQLSVTVRNAPTLGWLIPLLVLAAGACWTLALRSLRQTTREERIGGWSLVPLGLVSLVPGLMYAGFFPVYGIGLLVAGLAALAAGIAFVVFFIGVMLDG